MIRLLHKKADDIFNIGIGRLIVSGSHEAFQPMRPEAFTAPDALNDVLAEAEFSRQRAARPSGGSIRGSAASGRDHPLFQFVGNYRCLTSGRQRTEDTLNAP